MKEWQIKELGNVLTLQRGYDLPSQFRQGGSVPIVSSSGITGYHNESKESGPGVVTGRYGTLGEVHFVKTNYWPLNTTLFVKDFKGNYPRFIYYLLKVTDLESSNSAGAVPGLNRNALHTIKVAVPPLPIQRRIADILGQYDALIDNYQQQISKLENMAQEIYREWFVRGRCPYAQPSKDGGLPEGWERTELGNLSSVIQRGISPAYDEEGKILCLNQRCIRDGRIDYSIGRSQSKQVSVNRTVCFGDVLINSTGEGTLGRTAQVYTTVDNVTVDSHVTIARPNKDVSPEYYGFLVASLENYFEAMALGSTGQTELLREVISGAKVIRPDRHSMEKFGVIIAPIKIKIANLQNQLIALRQTRDALLPRLLSGQIVVEEMIEQ
ncbi:restriction endonuclease subunit S [Spirosoma sordidisoli]|uniref:Restriction endonuclease subunit S n=1 Tax=Spirosoma sordidisoli TaxID=2502893 RepID=A0A4V1RWE8_9BACT|nr:restriction endonuclease subunit S [Spirosoma sordidisoli]RYC70018.1 restriction endonuclease subunit S [Spirosoma sordidisoli]